MSNIQKDTGLDINILQYMYLVEPYIFNNFAKEKFIKIFNNTKNIELRIIGSRYCIPEFLYNFKATNPGKYSNLK